VIEYLGYLQLGSAAIILFVVAFPSTQPVLGRMSMYFSRDDGGRLTEAAREHGGWSPMTIILSGALLMAHRPPLEPTPTATQAGVTADDMSARPTAASLTHAYRGIPGE
jgi:hypothetical protein